MKEDWLSAEGAEWNSIGLLISLPSELVRVMVSVPGPLAQAFTLRAFGA